MPAQSMACVVLTVVEPLTGQRLVRVYSQRTQKEYTEFMLELATLYPAAVKNRLVQDNGTGHPAQHPQSQLILLAFVSG